MICWKPFIVHFNRKYFSRCYTNCTIMFSDYSAIYTSPFYFSIVHVRRWPDTVLVAGMVSSGYIWHQWWQWHWQHRDHGYVETRVNNNVIMSQTCQMSIIMSQYSLLFQAAELCDGRPRGEQQCRRCWATGPPSTAGGRWRLGWCGRATSPRSSSTCSQTGSLTMRSPR